MPAHLDLPDSAPTTDHDEQQDDVRLQSRSPHPYHRQNFELLHPSDHLVYRRPFSAATSPPDDHQDAGDSHPSPSPTTPGFSKDSTPASDSGTEADDEHFLKGLPAPRARLHKGLRGRSEALSGASTPLLSPSIPEHQAVGGDDGEKLASTVAANRLRQETTTRCTRNLLQRLVEVALLALVGTIAVTNPQIHPLIRTWLRELRFTCILLITLLILYPIRVVVWAYTYVEPSRRVPFSIPADFDPAPVLYPPFVTLVVSSRLSINNEPLLLLNIILSICSLPAGLIPLTPTGEPFNSLHWALSCLPLRWIESQPHKSSLLMHSPLLSPEFSCLLYPLFQTLTDVLRSLTTTSLLPAELHLFSVALINILFFSTSPQMVILKSLLWGGGIGILLLCGPVITSAIALARVPKWRFKWAPPGSRRRSLMNAIFHILTSRRLARELLGRRLSNGEIARLEPLDTSDSADEGSPIAPLRRTKTLLQRAVPTPKAVDMARPSPGTPQQAASPAARRHTFPSPARGSKTHTASGRRRRATSTSVRSFFRLTQEQASMRKWLYALYVYICTLAIILGGIRLYVTRYALDGHEAIGWAAGYLLGDQPWFRFRVVKANLERWICLPLRPDEISCQMGWVEHIRQNDFGAANTRLLVSAFWLTVLVFGLVVVHRLKDIYEVDTRRKVFHFMMVAMFLPATYIDPTFAALALSLVLAIFLMLDLLRASQLPPLSKPIATYLAPYVDGRDFRGPVVISHIFLLIGCAIPMWLTLASLPRTGQGCLAGWEVPTREVSMVSGVVCVGLGDAAASLIGRRYGHRKWVWGGGKSLEGSAAFTIAVFAGLVAATAWLRIGRWPVDGETGPLPWPASIRNAGICAAVSSLTEAVLTGGNDNVIVPVVLWVCVKGLGV